MVTNNKKLAKCPECGIDVDSRGLAGHMKFKHGIVNPAETKAQLSSPPSPRAENTNVNQQFDTLFSLKMREALLNQLNPPNGGNMADVRREIAELRNLILLSKVEHTTPTTSTDREDITRLEGKINELKMQMEFNQKVEEIKQMMTEGKRLNELTTQLDSVLKLADKLKTYATPGERTAYDKVLDAIGPSIPEVAKAITQIASQKQQQQFIPTIQPTPQIPQQSQLMPEEIEKLNFLKMQEAISPPTITPPAPAKPSLREYGGW